MDFVFAIINRIVLFFQHTTITGYKIWEVDSQIFIIIPYISINRFASYDFLTDNNIAHVAGHCYMVCGAWLIWSFNISYDNVYKGK